MNEEKLGTDEQVGVVILRSCTGTGALLGGFLHIPVATAIVKSNLQNFWKFLGLSIVVGDGMECIRAGIREFHKAVEVLQGTEKAEDEESVENVEVNVQDGLHEVKPEE